MQIPLGAPQRPPTPPVSAAAGTAPGKRGLKWVILVIVLVALLVATSGIILALHQGSQFRGQINRAPTSESPPNLTIKAEFPLSSPALLPADLPSSDSALESPSPVHLSPDSAADPAPVLGRAHWDNQFERVENGAEAELLVRVGSISNLGFGWPDGFDPFSGKSTPSHGYPWDAAQDSPAGLKRILLGTGVTSDDLETRRGDGYSKYMRDHNTHVQPITVPLGRLPAKIEGVLFQFFLDDFQAPHLGSHFQISLNGTRIPAFEQDVNAIDQTGPIGKLVSLPLIPEYFDTLRSGTVNILFDDPVTHVPDGFAIDFVRVLVNPHPLKYVVQLQGTVMDAESHKTLSDATVSSAMASTQTGPTGSFTLSGIPAGLVVATASHEGYLDDVKTADVEAGEAGQVVLELHRTKENAASLEKQIEKTGIAIIYGIHFDVNKATLRSDSLPALEAMREIINKDAAAKWVVSGHTDNSGTREHNAALSLARAQSVCRWLESHEIDAAALRPVGFGALHPIANNATSNGRALNRRVELQRQN